MRAYYYSIVNKVRGSTVLEGIIRNSEDTIYPQQETYIPELPYECEAHNFSAPNYKLIGWKIELSFGDVVSLRVK